MNSELALFRFAAIMLACGCSSAPITPTDGAGSSGAGSSAAGSSAAGSSATGSGGTAPALVSEYVDYPPGPYGTARGATIQNLEFLGWRHPDQANYDVTRFEKVRLSDFYNPDGRSDLKLLAVNASAVWCTVCRAEYQDLNSNDTYATLRPKGLEMLGTLFEDVAYYPAQPADLTRWGESPAHAVKFPLVLDPGFKMGAYFDSDATPLNLLIDVRTMTIVRITMGYSATYFSDVQSLLDKL